jgi:hypothetical protein
VRQMHGTVAYPPSDSPDASDAESKTNTQED